MGHYFDIASKTRLLGFLWPTSDGITEGVNELGQKCGITMVQDKSTFLAPKAEVLVKVSPDICLPQ